jgi:uncharacterized protein
LSGVNTEITVIKRNYLGQETWRYTGKVIRRLPDAVVIEAFFNRADMAFHGIVLREGDRFVEQFFSNRWYNIFAVHDRDDNQLKCWYCNIGKPAVIHETELSYIDLALDLLVFPDGTQLVLDEDEFIALNLSEEERLQAGLALKQLQALFSSTQPDDPQLHLT